jgi:hypothetical protein
VRPLAAPVVALGTRAAALAAVLAVAAVGVLAATPRPPGARCWTTGSNFASEGSSSIRPTRSDFSLDGTTDSTRVPSMSFSVSTRSWSPTDEPAGRIDPSSTPRGSRAPAARQVQEPSGDELVSSISMRIDIGVPPYRLVPSRLQ